MCIRFTDERTLQRRRLAHDAKAKEKSVLVKVPTCKRNHAQKKEVCKKEEQKRGREREWEREEKE